MLARGGIATEVLDLNVRLIRALFEEGRAAATCATVRRCADPPLSAREAGALDWFERAAAGGWIDEHPQSVAYALRAMRRVLYPVPDRLEDCLTELTGAGSTDGLYAELLTAPVLRRPTAIGISVAFSAQLAAAIAIARLVRSSAPDTSIMLGGSQINLLQPAQLDLLAGSGLFDEILTTNGEHAICELVRSACRRPAANVVTSPALTTADLRDLPRPPFDDVSLYMRPLTIPVLATKGYNWGKCSFCDYVRPSDIGTARYIARPVGEVLDAIAAIDTEVAPDRVMLVSDAVPPGWYRQLATAAVERG